MHIGVNAWVWSSPVTTDDLRVLAPKVAAMGFDLIEFGIEGTEDIDYRLGAEIIRDAGLAVSVTAAMGPDRDLIHPDEAIRSNGTAYLRHCIEAANTLGATNLVGPMYSSVGRTWQQTEVDREKDLDLLVRQLGGLALEAYDRGVVLCLEPLNRFETSFVNIVEQGVEIVDRVDHPAVGLLLDTFHMNIEEKSIGGAIRLAGFRMKHLHACENDRGAPGSGHVPWQEVAAACSEIGYDGPAVIESFTSKVKSIAKAAAIWRSFEASQDVLATSGLSFLRKLFRQGINGSSGER